MHKRLKNIELRCKLNNAYMKPDFENWTDERLDQYIKTETEKFHKEHLIKNFRDAERVYNYFLNKELITKSEHKIFIKGEKEFWNN